MEKEALPGDIVYAKAGRDKGGYFVVVSAEGEYAYICNGKSRKVMQPKKKKLKHLRLKMGYSEFIAGKLSRGERVTNTELRRELEEYNEEKNEEAR